MRDNQAERIKRQRGQIDFAFLIWFSLIAMAFAITSDLGRFLAMRGKAVTLADSMALACAGSVDIARFEEQGDVWISRDWCRKRAEEVFVNVTNEDEIYIGGLDYTWRVDVRRDEVVVTVNGTSQCRIMPLFGIAEMNTSVSSKARAAWGIDDDRGL